MQVFGKVHKILPKDEGVSASGNYYSKQTIVISIGEEGKKLAIEFFGDKKVAKLQDLKTDDLVMVTFFLESRPIEKDLQERWFTSVSGSNILVYSAKKSEKESEKESENNHTLPLVFPEQNS